MKSGLLIVFVLLNCILLHAQNEHKKFKPTSYIEPDLSKKTKKEIERQGELLKKEELTEIEKEELEVLLEKYGETTESVWDVVSGGCSWYCGGGNYKVKASSALNSYRKRNYGAQSANDLSYETAWVEGVEGSGIGEYLEFSFKNDSPRITTIIISNGYMRSEESWKYNNRVKAIKFYVNGKLFGILELSDTRTNQVFELGTFGWNKNGSDLLLKFEILEVYKGEKFDDTAITEIYFDGIDVH